VSLASLVRSLADNKQLLGLRYAEWCTAAPTLEADIAGAAMGLDDLGHSRVLHGSLRELGEPDPLPHPTTPERYLNVAYFDQPWTRWDQFVAANAVLDTAFTVMIEALANGHVEVLRSRLRKMLQEEHYHYLHGRSWLRETNAGPEVARAFAEAVEWLGPDGGEVDDFHRQGQLAEGVKGLRRRLEERVGADLPPVRIDWEHWDPVRRRTRPGGMDVRTFEMLRGLEEKRYMPAGGDRGEA
jgi:1,2-phenylacetyl-CoA epoxidase catalytic subunit